MTGNPKIKLPPFINVDNQTKLDDIAAWNKIAPGISAAMLYKAFADPRLGLSGRSFTIGEYGIDVILDFSRENVPTGELNFSIKGRYIDLDKLFVTQNKNGIGTNIFLALLELATRHGKEMSVNADYEVGPRFWAQMGFKIDENYSDTMRNKMRRRWDKIKPTISERDADIVELIDGLLAKEYLFGYELVWAISDISYAVIPLEENPGLLKKDANGKIPLSLAILSGKQMSWSGSFPAGDLESIQRVEAYLHKRGIEKSK